MRRRLKERLSADLRQNELTNIYNSFDIVGDIAILKIDKHDSTTAQVVAKQVIAVHGSVKTVLAQRGPVAGAFRVRNLTLLAGENKTTTRHRESGCTFTVDVQKCYFSPRLSHERLRIARLVKKGEAVVNMFAGVGCFSILIAKTAPESKVYSIDVNPSAVRFMVENVRINRVYGKVIPILGDSKEIISAQLQHQADRVLMPLPERALDYLPYAVQALKPSGGWIHFYDFQHAAGLEDPLEKTKRKVAKKLDSLSLRYSFEFSRVVRSIGPNWYQTVLDISMDEAPSKF